MGLDAQHTPGPWEARPGSLHRQNWLIDAPGRRFIATCDGPADKEGEANGRLIAAAPDLLAALQQIATGHIVGEPNNHRDTLHVVREIAQAAIAKALGEQSTTPEQSAYSRAVHGPLTHHSV